MSRLAFQPRPPRQPQRPPNSNASKPNGADDAIDQSTAAAPPNITADGVDLSPEPSENVSAPGGANKAEKRHHLPRPLPLRPSKEATNAQSAKRSPLARITTLDHLVQELIRRKTTPPKPNKDGTQGNAPWTYKTARQVRGVGQLFAAVVGSDDLNAIGPEHIATYRRTIDRLPVSFGQSSIKRNWTLDQIFEDAEDLPPERIGRAAGTINRHFNQLGAILKAAGSEGYKIPDLQELLRAQREAEPDKEAPTFVCEEVRVLADGCATVGAPSLYWVTLLCMYSGARRSELCGLRIVEIDLIKGVIILEPNSYRGLKTPRSRRRIPLHPELIRLGFLEYVKKIAATGSDLLFPDLRERGENTPLGDLFGKQFEKLITEVLPEARANGKTFHSLRHYVNSEMIKALVLDVTRYKIMGHKSGDKNGNSVGKDVNIDVYSHFDDETLLRAISTLPAVTSTLEPRIW